MNYAAAAATYDDDDDEADDNSNWSGPYACNQHCTRVTQFTIKFLSQPLNKLANRKPYKAKDLTKLVSQFFLQRGLCCRASDRKQFKHVNIIADGLITVTIFKNLISKTLHRKGK